jgi:hypothetical protein
MTDLETIAPRKMFVATPATAICSRSAPDVRGHSSTARQSVDRQHDGRSERQQRLTGAVTLRIEDGVNVLAVDADARSRNGPSCRSSRAKKSERPTCW